MNLSLLSLLDLKKNGSDSFTPVCLEGVALAMEDTTRWACVLCYNFNLCENLV